MNETEDSIGAEVSIIDLNEVPMEFIMTGIFINYEMGCGQLKLCGDDISWLSHALRILDLDTKYVSGHNHRQDPNGPFPGTLYTHGEFKMHQNRKNRKGDKAWYTCAKAATGCPAVAWVEAYTVEREDGTTVWQHRYTKVSPYEVKYNYFIGEFIDLDKLLLWHLFFVKRFITGKLWKAMKIITSIFRCTRSTTLQTQASELRSWWSSRWRRPSRRTLWQQLVRSSIILIVRWIKTTLSLI